MEQEQEQVITQEQQSINSPLEQSSQSLASSSPTPPTGGGTGVDPNEQARYFKHLSDTSIQAQEAARWQTMANNSPRALQEGLIKDSATQKAVSDSPLTVPEETGIPKNMQLSIEYMTKISLKEVRVHYDSQEAVEQGVATFHEGMNIYVAPGKKKQLGEEVWKVAEEIKQQSGSSGDNQTDSSQDTIPTELSNPNLEVEQPETTTSTGELNSDNQENILENTGGEGQQPLGGGLSDLGSIEENPLPEGIAYKSEKPVPITPKPLPTTNTDQGFKAVKSAIHTEGHKQQEHQSSEQEVEAAHKASVEPTNKKSSIAQGNHMGVLEQKETPAFETNAFVEALMAKVRDIMPRDKDQADDFKKSGKVGQVKRAVSNSVSASKDKSVGPLEQANKETPNTAGIPSKQVAPLPPAAVGQNPADIQAQKAVPKPLDKDRVEQPLQNNSKSLDEQMASNEMTEEQLSKSNEPTFQAALDSKNTAQQDSEEKTKQARQEEQKQRQKNQQEAESLGQEQMTAMHQDRASIMTGVHQKQQGASTNYTAEEQKVADKINSLFATTKSEVESKLSRLDARVQQLFDKGAANAQRQFEAYVEAKLNAYKEERYAGLSGKVSWVSDAFTGLPDEVNAFFREGRNAYIRSMKRVIQNIARIVARELNAAKKRVQTGKQQVADYVNSLPDNLRKVGQQAAQDINSKFDELSSQVDAKQEELIDTLATKYTQNLKNIDDRIEQLKAENKGLIDAAFEHLKGTWETIQKVKAMLTGALNAAGEAIKAIILDPIGFLGNLIDGVGQGLNNFLGGIHQHLTTGFVEWLTGTMSSVGIQIPEDIFSLEGIFSITSQALGLTWDFIRARAVNILGEKPVEAIEEGFEIFQVIQEKGIAGAWEHLKEQFSDLKATIMDSMMGMLITEVVEAGIKWVLGLLTPAGAFVKAAMMIVDIAKFFINQGSQLVELVNAFTASISAIVAGNVAQVAKGIEKALGISVPVLIGFLAALVGIGDLAAKVQKIFKKITGRIHKAIDGFIEKAGAWFKDKKGRRKAKRDAKKKEKEDKKKDGEEEKEDPKDKAKAEKGLRLGTAVVKNENLTKEQIEVELKKIERQEKLKDLDARLVEEAEQWHTFMLKSKAGSSKKEERIRRKPTKATNEEEVSEADRQLHKRIAGEVKAKLEAKGKSTEGVETFEAFYEMLRGEAVKLQREYQPQLRNGIKIAVDLVNRVQQDKKDGDVDIRVRIAPNATEEITAIEFISDIENTTDTHDKEVISLIKEAVNEAYGQGFLGLNSEEEIQNRFDEIYEEIKSIIDEYKSEPSFKGINYKDSGKKLERIIYVTRTANNNPTYQVGKVVVHFTDADYRTRMLKETEGVKNPVYEDRASGEELVKDRTEQYIPRKGHRYINEEDSRKVSSNSDIVSRGTQDKNELEHMISSNNSTRLSTTVEGKKQIVGADGNTFNSNGQVDIDFAQIPREELSAVYTKEGLQRYVKGNLPTRNRGQVVTERELQAFVDGVRTQEVLIGKSGMKGRIPTSAYSNRMGKAATDRARPLNLNEPTALTAKKEEWKRALRRGQTLDPDDVIDEILKLWK